LTPNSSNNKKKKPQQNENAFFFWIPSQLGQSLGRRLRFAFISCGQGKSNPLPQVK
jgi:hypothetical protein